MSLESQVAALVSAANKLTSEVAAKMRGIDKKVDDATKSVPGVVREYADMEFYIDALSGDDNNPGNMANPLRTASEAAKRIIPSSAVSLRFKGGQKHIIDFSSSCTRVFLGTWGLDSAGKARLYGSVRSSDPGSVRVNALHSNSNHQTIVMRDVEIHCAAELDADETRVIDQFKSNFIFGDQGRDVFVFNSIIFINEYSFTGIHAGYASRELSIGSSTIRAVGKASGKLVNSRANAVPTLILSINAVELAGFNNWSEILPLKSSSDASNILSNIKIV